MGKLNDGEGDAKKHPDVKPGDGEGTATVDATGAEGKSKSGSSDGPGTGGRTFTQAELEEEIRVRLERERRKNERAAEEAQRKAEEDALQKRQEFEVLAKQRGDRVAVLESDLTETAATLEETQSRIQELETLIANDVKAQIEELDLRPSTVQLLEKLSVTERRDWLTQHREELAKSGVSPRGAKPSPEDKNTRSKPRTSSEADDMRRREYYRRMF